MKAKLLRKLRRKYAKKYCITKAENDNWKVWFGYNSHSYWLVSSIERAQEKVKNEIWKDISEELITLRKKKGRKRCIRYYPWVIILFVFLPIFCQAQTRQQVLAELKRQNIPHPTIVLAQARLESGNMKSAFYKRTNNLFGLKRGKKYATYRHWKDSVKDYKKRISSRYTKGSYYSFLERIGYATEKEYIKKLKEVNKKLYEKTSRAYKERN